MARALPLHLLGILALCLLLVGCLPPNIGSGQQQFTPGTLGNRTVTTGTSTQIVMQPTSTVGQLPPTPLPQPTQTPQPNPPFAPTATPTGAAPAATATRPVVVPTSAVPGATATVSSAGSQPVTVDGAVARYVAVASNSTVYAATTKGVYQRSGTNWNRVSTETNIENLAAENDGLLLSGKPDECYIGTPGIPLRVSTDSGRTWSAPFQDRGRTINARPVPTYGSRLHAISCAGIYYSDDRGRTWRWAQMLADPYDVFDLATDPTAQTLYIAGTSEGGSGVILKTTRNSSGAWADPQHVLEYWGRGTVAVSAAGTVYVGTVQGVQFSTDGGKTWRPQNTGLAATTVNFDPSKDAPPNAAEEAKLRAGAGINTFAFSADGRSIFLGGLDGIYARDNAGQWQRRAVQGQKVLEIQTGNDSFFVRTAQGVFEVRLP